MEERVGRVQSTWADDLMPRRSWPISVLVGLWSIILTLDMKGPSQILGQHSFKTEGIQKEKSTLEKHPYRQPQSSESFDL